MAFQVAAAPQPGSLPPIAVVAALVKEKKLNSLASHHHAGGIKSKISLFWDEKRSLLLEDTLTKLKTCLGQILSLQLFSSV